MLAAVLKAPGLRRGTTPNDSATAMVRIAGGPMVKLNARWKKPDAAHLAWTPPKLGTAYAAMPSTSRPAKPAAIQGSDQVMTVNASTAEATQVKATKLAKGTPSRTGGLGVDGGSAQSTRLNPPSRLGRPAAAALRLEGMAEAYDRGAASTRGVTSSWTGRGKRPSTRPPSMALALAEQQPERRHRATRSSQASELLSQCGSQARGALRLMGLEDLPWF